MNKCPGAPSRQIRRQTYEDVEEVSKNLFSNVIQIQIQTPKVKSPASCPGAPSRNIHATPYHIKIEIPPLVLDFESESESEIISSPPAKRRRIQTPTAPIKDNTTVSRISEDVERELSPITIQF